ncbi:hypothetical protein C8T65DRAFT_743344 [Cerioporus squamosus]|nr:hypothetical protein C8T65DRAFT_743344 [Cerioporus squamosus]
MHKVRGSAAQCCESLELADSPVATAAFEATCVVAQDANVLVDLKCSRITVVGVGAGGTCSGTTVLCASRLWG